MLKILQHCHQHLSILRNYFIYFNSPTKLFLNLYLAKFSDISFCAECFRNWTNARNKCFKTKKVRMLFNFQVATKK